MPTSHPRVQVTKDPELARALREAAPRLKPGMPVSQQIRELAILGSRHLTANDQPLEEGELQRRLELLAGMFENPESALWDWDVLKDVKSVAWRTL